jgi:DNA polymerase-3 subunit beta
MTGVSLDGFRLSKIEKDIKNFAGETKVIVPGRSLDEVKKLTDGTEDVEIILDGKFFQVNVNKTTFAGRLIDGEFINYNQIIPTKFESNAVVERAAFEQAVERARLLVRNDKVNVVTLAVADKSISITSNNEIGRIAEKVSCALTGKDIKIAFNASYIADVLRGSTDEFLKIMYNGELLPCIITGAKPCDYTFLVLPVRL